MNLNDYLNIKANIINGLSEATFSNEELNHIHDLIYDQVISAAVSKLSKEYGNPPLTFLFLRHGQCWTDGAIYLE
ncbi:hypothetical protein LC048_09760 [Mesobacillus subterraneus]|uniref:hypothetical protein n=1 Tax=Mesobacillus subterraneus TaxID=285983 RepID=UPI00273E3946|nr:hypothetical protein [Mesobacillus subterraneus]WLR57809.1 hypothetical protein LC048_09760 [Mesobacillus subterraneus]